MNKYEFKYMYEQEATKVENLIDVVGKNAHHIQDLSAELKKKDENIDKLIARLNDKRETLSTHKHKRTCGNITLERRALITNEISFRS
jgi:hypothetical protein